MLSKRNPSILLELKLHLEKCNEEGFLHYSVVTVQNKVIDKIPHNATCSLTVSIEQNIC